MERAEMCFATASAVVARRARSWARSPVTHMAPGASTRAIASPVRSQRAVIHMITDIPTDDKKYDVLLGELVFTEPDKLPALVQSRLDQLDDSFYEFVQSKIAASIDLDERETLSILTEAIKDLVSQIKTGAGLPTDGEANSQGPQLSDEERAVASYDTLIDMMVKAAHEKDSEIALAATIQFKYEEIDKTLLDRLQERITTETSAEEKEALTLTQNAINAEMGKRMATAAEKLKAVVTAGPLDSMRKELERLTNKGGLDDAFVLLLQGNIEQARKADATQAVQMLSAVMEHASRLKERKLTPEVRLIRQLLRTDEEDARKDLLKEALEPRRSVFLPDGSKSTGVRVDGKEFVVALRDLIETYGNVEPAFIEQLSMIGEESEEVAREIFGIEDKDIQDLQEEAFHKRSVSVWDLEKVEMQEEVEGRKSMWEGKLGDIPAGFDEHGKMAI